MQFIPPILSVITVLAAFIVSVSPLAGYGLQIAALMMAVYAGVSFLIRKHILSTDIKVTLDVLVFSLTISLLIFTTGGFASPVFFLSYFLLFGVALFSSPITATAITLTFALLFFVSPKKDFWLDLLQIGSLLAIAPLSVLFGKQYLKVLQDKRTISGLFQKVRKNKVDVETLELLKSRLDKDPQSGRESTRLYTHNIDVDVVNKKHLDLLGTPKKDYHMTSKGARNLAETLKKNCLSPEVLELKKGARVMFTKNHNEGGYVNGTLGVVVDFNSFGDPIIETNNGMKFSVTPQSWKIEEEGKIKAEISQYPLRLAWAITVHKSQGMSLDAMEVDLSKSFVRGMGYVALSRVRSLDGMKLLGFNDMSLEIDLEVLEMDEKFQKESDCARTVLAQLSPILGIREIMALIL